MMLICSNTGFMFELMHLRAQHMQCNLLLNMIRNIHNYSFGTEKKEMTGLAIGVSNMKSGERALLHVGWELGYGKEGSFSFPNVPPMADILYEVELIGFDETKEVSFSFMIFQSFFIAVSCLNFIVCELIIEFNI